MKNNRHALLIAGMLAVALLHPTLSGILIAMLVLTAVVAVHEFGHLLMGWLAGIRIDAYSLMFPPTIWKKEIGEVEYRLGSIPLGGYVTPHQPQEGEVKLGRTVEDVSGSKQLLFFGGGILFNMIAAYLTIVLAVSQGWVTFDKILSGNEAAVATPTSLLAAHDQAIGLIGFQFEMIYQVLTGQAQGALSGPVGIIAFGSSLSQSFEGIILLFIILNLGIGAMQLLPIPALDGCHMLFAVLKCCNFEPSRINKERLQLAGIALLLLLTVTMTYLDVRRLFT